MERSPISTEALVVLINKELATLAPCHGVEVASIEVLPAPDAHGCNWRIASFAHGRPPEPCDSLAAIAVWALQWRYNVVG
jgi:hypothetical protein